MTIRAHFDGKVIVPNEPLDLKVNQRLIVHLETVEDRATDFRSWLGIANAAPPNPTPRFESDADLWD